MSQRDLAKKVKREVSFVWRIETGRRRLDVVEFYWVCKALGRNAADVYRELVREIAAGQRQELNSAKKSSRSS